MARIHEYTDDDGYYIRISYHGRPQTLQVRSTAADLLTELGYQSGDSLPRDIVKPLIAIDELHTKPGGPRAKKLLRDLPALAPDRCQLSQDRLEQLRSFLQRGPIDYTADQLTRLNDFLQHESPLAPIENTDDSAQSDNSSAPDTDVTKGANEEESLDLAASSTDEELAATVPTDLLTRDQWICWRYETRDGKETKVPIDPQTDEYADVSDPDTWYEYETAVEAAGRLQVEGVGFVFSPDDTIAGVDLDDVYDPATEEIAPKAQDIIERLNSYTEFSPSKTGFHVLLHGFCPNGRLRHDGIEMYDERRFFTVTGNHLPNTPETVEVSHHDLASIHAEYVAVTTQQETDEPAKTSRVGATAQPTVPDDVSISDERILRRAKQRSDKFEALWAGQTHDYPSHSEADMALCVLLAVHCGGDITRMDRLFRRSGLMRDKWDASRGERTYGELTMQKAVQFVDEYDPLIVERDTPEHVDMAALEPEMAATVEGTVTTVHDAPQESIHQWGRLQDDTAAVKFVIWDNTDNSDRLSMTEGSTYRLQDVWVSRFDNSTEIELNEYTKIEALD